MSQTLLSAPTSDFTSNTSSSYKGATWTAVVQTGTVSALLKTDGVICTVTVCKHFVTKGCQCIVEKEFEKVGFRKYSLFIMRKKQTKSKSQNVLCKLCNANYLKFLSEEIIPSLQYFQMSFDCTE